MLFIQCKNCMTTSESKGRFFYKTNRFESIRITNRIYSNRELECSTDERTTFHVMRYDTRCCFNVRSNVSFIYRREPKTNKVSTPGSGETICPQPMAVRSKNRGRSTRTSVRGPVRSPHISGGRRWLSCRRPACL